jgi:hypothetical protein
VVWLTSSWEAGASPYLHASWQAFGCAPNNQLNQHLPELVLIEGIQLVAMKPDESLSPSLFTFRSHFAAIHHH